MKIEDLLVIDAPHFCAAVIFDGGHVVNAAPILDYMKGWSRKAVEDYCQVKSWEIGQTIKF